MILNYCAPCHDIEINKIKKFFDSNSIIFGVAGQDNVPYKRNKVTDKTLGKGSRQCCLGTIHLRHRQIFTIFDPYPPPVGNYSRHSRRQRFDRVPSEYIVASFSV